MAKTKKCFKCLTSLPMSEFYDHPMMADGKLGKCKGCARRDVRENRERRRRYYLAWDRERAKNPMRKYMLSVYQRKSRARNREKWIARGRVAYAVSSGKITRGPCAVCGDKKSQAHHPDYAKPLEVVWLCFKHHREVHGQRV